MNYYRGGRDLPPRQTIPGALEIDLGNQLGEKFAPIRSFSSPSERLDSVLQHEPERSVLIFTYLAQSSDPNVRALVAMNLESHPAESLISLAEMWAKLSLDKDTSVSEAALKSLIELIECAEINTNAALNLGLVREAIMHTHSTIAESGVDELLA
jgi:hypothetical protein